MMQPDGGALGLFPSEAATSGAADHISPPLPHTPRKQVQSLSAMTLKISKVYETNCSH